MRIPFAEHVAARDLLAVIDLEHGAVRNFVARQLASFFVHNENFAVALEHHDAERSVLVLDLDGIEIVILHDALLRRLQHVFHRGLLGNAAGVEGAHGELRSRFADGLGSDDADGQAFLNEPAGGHIHAVAKGANAARAFAGERAADANLVQTEPFDARGDFLGNQLVFGQNHFIGHQVADRIASGAAHDVFAKTDVHFLALVGGGLGHAIDRAAVVMIHDYVLGDVGELAGEVAGVGGLERGVGQSLACAVRGAEVFEHGETFAKVGLDGRLDDFAGRFGHEGAHAGELTNLVNATASAGLGHQVNRIQIGLGVGVAGSAIFAGGSSIIIAQLDQHGLGHELAGVNPDIDDLVVSLEPREGSLVEGFLHVIDFFLGRVDDSLLGLGHTHVRQTERQAGQRAALEADFLDVVEEVDGCGTSQLFVTVGHHAH